jgi:hypothetical protein
MGNQLKKKEKRCLEFSGGRNPKIGGPGNPY